MILIDYPHSKQTYYLKFVDVKKNLKTLLNTIKIFQKSFTTYKQGVMNMTSKTKLYFMIQEHKS
jgi:hypothetical protein